MSICERCNVEKEVKQVSGEKICVDCEKQDVQMREKRVEFMKQFA